MAARCVCCILLLGAAGCVGRIEGSSGEHAGPPGSIGPVGGSNMPAHTPVETPDGTKVSCDKPSVGVVPLARLSRAQYASSVHDLTGLDFDLDAVLPEDEKIGAFYRNSVAPVSATELSAYRDAAELIAKRVAGERKELWACPSGQQGATCAASVIKSLGERLQRAPLSDEDATRYLTVFNAQAATSFESGMSAVLEAMLQSPLFLYRVELPDGSTGPRALSGYELATRLSFLLWNSAPDATLLEKAKAGQLASVDQVRNEAQRLLADPRAERALSTFHREWLEIAELPERPKDSKLFPDFTAESASAMQRDAERFAVVTLLRGDGKLASLLQAPFTAALDGTSRTGLLLQPAFLAAHASADQTSIVLRGNFVRSRLLCDAPPPPPPNADVQAPELDPNSTLRQRFAAHESDPTCAGCHTLMDPIGFGFESYDAVGRFRSTEAGKPVDTSGEVSGSDDADGKFNGPVELASRLAASEQVRKCVAQQWFDYAFGRGVDAGDACAFQTAYEQYRASGDDLRQLLLAYVASDAFRLRTEASP